MLTRVACVMFARWAAVHCVTRISSQACEFSDFPYGACALYIPSAFLPHVAVYTYHHAYIDEACVRAMCKNSRTVTKCVERVLSRKWVKHEMIHCAHNERWRRVGSAHLLRARAVIDPNPVARIYICGLTTNQLYIYKKTSEPAVKKMHGAANLRWHVTICV